MKKIILLLALSGFIGLTNANACSCTGPNQFFPDGQNTDTQDLIIKAKKIADVSYGMKVKVIEQLSGERIENKTLMIWGDPGHLCRLGTGILENDQEYMLRISQLSDPLPDYWNDFTGGNEKAGEYEISHCGLHYLRIENGQVKAPNDNTTIDGKLSSLSYQKFKNLFNGEVNIPFTIKKPIGESKFTIALEEDVEIPEMGGQIQLISLDGKLNQAIAIIPKEKQIYTLDYAGLPNGVYLVRMLLGKNVQMKKVMLFDEY